ncbi:MAG: hypothetical protein ABSC37_09100 [Xanthobacteraceae bacterium]|jgi:hypothetical protein
MRSLFLSIAALILIACLAVQAMHAEAARGFPSVKEIEAALNLYPGARIPQDLLIGGERYHAEYVGAEARRGGQYAIVVKLER